MCGFLGEFLFFSNDLTSKEQFADLLRLSNHRGPDNTQIVNSAIFQLGFNRLAILDLSANGNQPKHSPSKRYHVVFNGELYNFKELKNRYNLTNLKPSSDTEVLVHLIDKIGVERTLKVLNGMFGIAVIDEQEDILYLSRDFAGIKPLFYGISKNGVVFASQFNQIFKHPFFESQIELRQDVLKEYFGLGYMQSPNTIYKNIFQVNPGEMLKISRKGKITTTTILKFDFSPLKNNEKALSITDEEFEVNFSEVIKRQLVSDVPLATFLSGGIDSPLVNAIAKKLKPDIEAFTIGVDDVSFDESKKASEYATHININHHIEHIKSKDLLDCIDAHFRSLSEPFGDYSSIPTFIITKLARQHHTVMLSGDGADELFFGYPRMLDVMQKRLWFKIPFFIRKPMVRLAIKLKLTDSWGPYMFKEISDWILLKQQHITKYHLDRIIPNTTFTKELKALYHQKDLGTKNKLMSWLRYNEFYGHLQRVLIKVDRMSMANSLEVRVPFLDKKMVEFSSKYFPKIKKNTFALKGILKKTMEHNYPKSIIETKKRGFSVPIADWMRSYLRDDLEKHIFNTTIYGNQWINEEALRNYVSDFLEGKHEESWGIWNIYAWQKWASIHLK